MVPNIDQWAVPEAHDPPSPLPSLPDAACSWLTFLRPQKVQPTIEEQDGLETQELMPQPTTEPLQPIETTDLEVSPDTMSVRDASE